ncbi:MULTISPECIES: small, acid-soluble spore protein, alpha/beta type [Tissierella]|uniref:small, acid-soluble spore protein, alpha/beta type n=1 Tax=Tissierella TaxID=41273 RepID=UPI0028B173EC|nr:small, acid-soluble spore protein, alpha/beta type [Tissierella sp.]
MKKEKIETLEDKLKYEIAEELGLTEKIKEVGWAGLTAKESGRIGGLITVRKREMNKKNK